LRKENSAVSDALSAFLAPHDAAIRAIVLKARDLVLRLAPDAVETLDSENLGYGRGKGYAGLLLVIAPQRKHVNLGFFEGATLPDPHGLLEGTGKRHRHVKVRSEAELDNPAFLELVRAAVARWQATEG
jgi:hypothetical protein